MINCRNKLRSVVFFLILYASFATAQVQVSNEPHHKNVLENKYIRLLDVWINPGDTTQFHIHSTPSLFLYFTNTDVAAQEPGKEWVKNRNEMGKASYKSFANDTLVHRVCNLDTALFHVTDIELLSAYKTGNTIPPLAFPIILENEKAIAYRINQQSLNKNMISNRGPMIAELVEGKEVIYYDAAENKKTIITTGKYLYINPDSKFYFTANENINLVLFEIK